MATHNLFMGGKGPNGAGAPGTYNAQFFPSVAPAPEDYAPVDARRTPVEFGIKRQLVWKRSEGPLYYTDKPTSPGLAKYLEQNPIVAGDILNVIIVPKYSELVRVWWRVVDPLPGFDFNIRLDDSTAGGTVTTLNGAPISAAAAADGLIDPAAALGGIAYQPQNGLLQIEIVNLPAQGIEDSYIEITAVVRKFDTFGGN